MKRIIAIALTVLLLLSLTGCGFHRITVECRSFVDFCPKIALTGSTVTIDVVSVTDGYLEIYADGADDGKLITENEFQFTMPDRPVIIKGHMVATYDGA